MTKRVYLLAAAVIVIVGSIVYLESVRPDRPSGGGSDVSNPTITMSATQKAKQFERAKEIVNPSGFVNTDGITVSELVGKKVVLVDFWTYSCINCQRTQPYLNAWYEKYHDQGLEIIGVHTPEFEFEKDIGNVRLAVEQSGIKYPVVLDNDYATWNAYKNRYWPRKYLIDIDGFIVYDHIGEGGYEETERKIQELLKERKVALGDEMNIASDIARPSGTETASAMILTPEIYFGASRNEHLGNGASKTLVRDRFAPPQTMTEDTFYLLGDWQVFPEYAEAKEAGAGIALKYRAQKVFMVGSADSPVMLTIRRDGQPASTGEWRGRDVQPDGTVMVGEDRLYRLVEDPNGWGEHVLEIEISGPGLKAYTFTFG